MSFDLMVFNNAKAPKNEKDFLAWYEAQCEWSEEHNYDDPAVTTENLRNLFMELIQTFPPLNGELSPTDNDDFDWDNESYLTDYSIGKDVIYCAFAWSLAEIAEEKLRELAKKYNVGFFGASTDGCIEYNN